MSAYSVLTLELANSHDRESLVPIGTPVATVYVRRLPSPAFIHFGQGGPPWELEEGVEYEPCPAEREGVFISNPPGAGTLVIIPTYAEGAVSAQ